MESALNPVNPVVEPDFCRLNIVGGRSGRKFPCSFWLSENSVRIDTQCINIHM
jgi:hypothetical protein